MPAGSRHKYSKTRLFLSSYKSACRANMSGGRKFCTIPPGRCAGRETSSEAFVIIFHLAQRGKEKTNTNFAKCDPPRTHAQYAPIHCRFSAQGQRTHVPSLVLKPGGLANIFLSSTLFRAGEAENLKVHFLSLPVRTGVVTKVISIALEKVEN